MLDPDTRTIEAILLLSSEPIDVEALAAACMVEQRMVVDGLQALEQFYVDEGRGIRLERSRLGVRLVTAPEAGPAVARLQGIDRKPRLSAAALDALAIVAYRQPTTRSAVESIRGVGSEHVLTVLLNAGLIEDVGRGDAIGRPVLYGTTTTFLELAGITSLTDLPLLDEAPSHGELFDPDRQHTP
jgi:segregation and condensation protein B